MNELCFLTNLTSSDVAAWAQAIVSSLAIVIGVLVVGWQTHQTRLEAGKREARSLDGLALLIAHAVRCAETTKDELYKSRTCPQAERWDPSKRFQSLVKDIERFPIESVQGEAPVEALLASRAAMDQLYLLIGPEPTLGQLPMDGLDFSECIETMNRQVDLLRAEARSLMKGMRVRYTAPTGDSNNSVAEVGIL